MESLFDRPLKNC